MGLDLGSLGSGPGPKARAKPLSYPGIPRSRVPCVLFQILVPKSRFLDWLNIEKKIFLNEVVKTKRPRIPKKKKKKKKENKKRKKQR